MSATLLRTLYIEDTVYLYGPVNGRGDDRVPAPYSQRLDVDDPE
jgi:hypothetical protein